MKGTALRNIAAVVVICWVPCVARADDTSSSATASAQVKQCEGLASATSADRAQACTSLIESRTLSPKEAAIAYYFRAFVEVDLQQLPAATDDLTQAVALEPELWPARWLRAELRGARREYDGAAEDWTEVIKHNPQIATLYSHRGSAMDYLGHVDESAADLSKAIELGRTATLAADYDDRANLYEGIYDWNKALADYNEAILRDSNHYPAYRGRARVELLSGNVPAAVNDFTKAADAEPGDAYGVLWLFLAEARAGTNALPQLRRRAEKVDLKKWPGPIIETLLGQRRADQIETPSIPEGWTEADRLAGARCEMSFYVGETYLLKGDRQKAVAMFRAAVDTGIKEYIEYRMSAYELGHLAR